ncbi:MAG TPA: aminomethyl-transferring glycine dehydrogenase subunit GcvPA [Armatimonadota bacterium]|jgi:glycine dehydrogenase subunit 1
MTFVPNTDADRREMLATIGAKSVTDLFTDVPEAYRFPALALPSALSEMEVLREMETLAAKNDDVRRRSCFLGAGAYHHFVPSIVDFVLQRSEFYTAYTPYQPEISQGTLQAHYEYQTLICALTGMDAANVSHYDAGTAAAEAIILALGAGHNKRMQAILSPTLHPQYREVIHTYTYSMGVQYAGEEAPAGDLHALGDLLDEQTACVVVQNPDFFGRLYTPAEMQALADKVHAAGALLVVCAHPISLGLFQPPGAYGADIAIGEGQPLGNGLNFGGPYLGYFAMHKDLVRKSAGRIVGETVDAEGKRGYVLTLSSREQHIRRERASSNICSNQALNALAAAVYLAAMGKQGLRAVAELCYHKAHYATEAIDKLPGYAVQADHPFFNEFVVHCPQPVDAINAALLDRFGIVGGYDLGNQAMLLAVTEMNTREEIDGLVAALQELNEKI